MHKPGKVKADPLRGLFAATVDDKPAVVEYEPDADLRDTEQVPLLEDGGIEAFIRREVLPYTPDAWIKEDVTKVGYEVSFTRHFYKPQLLRTLEVGCLQLLSKSPLLCRQVHPPEHCCSAMSRHSCPVLSPRATGPSVLCSCQVHP